jgi:hypothetical protein
MRRSGKSVAHVTWIVCLVLFVVAILAHFGVIPIERGLGDYAWIIGYAVLLVAVKARGL